MTGEAVPAAAPAAADATAAAAVAADEAAARRRILLAGTRHCVPHWLEPAIVNKNLQ